jgi:GT2 family glycosyltransferase
MSVPEGLGIEEHENRIAIVIVNFHSEEFLQKCLAAIARQSHLPDRVVVVDNGSRADLLEESLGAYPRAELLRMPENVGYAAGNNRAVETVGDCRWVVLLNVDAFPEPGWLDALMRSAREHPDCAFFGSLLMMANSPGLIDGTGDVYHCSGRAWRRDHGVPTVEAHRSTEGTVAPCAAAAMYRYDAWLAVRGLDETFVCYLEDVDVGLRLQLLGYKYRFVPESIAHHIGSGVTRRHSSYYVYHGQRNIVWTYVKNMPGVLFWKYLPQHILLNILAVVWFVVRGRGLAVLHAKWDALCGLPRAWRQRRQIQQSRRVVVRDFDAQLAHGFPRLPRGL